MNLNHLAVFHAVAEAGGVTAGAERLQISQPAASKQIRELEAALGVTLFDRAGRGVRLTEPGRVLAGYARRLFALESEAEQAVGELRAVERGTLLIGASTTIGSYLIPVVLSAFHRRYPGVRVHIDVGQPYCLLEQPYPGFSLSRFADNASAQVSFFNKPDPRQRSSLFQG
jgi:DNA-binding transcriptional LysR family regulator